MDDDATTWITLPKFSEGYITGIRTFIKNASSRFSVGDEILCPCKKCKNDKWHGQDIVYNHLIYNGPSPFYMEWMCEVCQKGSDDVMDCEDGTVFGDKLGDMFLRMENGEDPPITAPSTHPHKFKHHMEEGKQPLYSGCLKFLRLSFIVRMYSLKCIHGITEAVFGDLLQLMREAFPDAHIPLSFSSAKNIIKDLGLDYQKNHACPNDFMIYWGENKDEKACKTCGISRWEVVEKKGITDNDPEKVIRKVPAKVMHYFPLKPRLQRLFMSKEYSKLMTWHDVGRKDDGNFDIPLMLRLGRRWIQDILILR
ncbi:uncharacterized protein LOC141686157 [Apium graveolens]|uniref:uncharacterized protein LOC141686157 n=1 Tax=Apium graveolens TaxID=4045 RepID=UPI003D7B064F